jgi:hypothetical protein
MIGRNALICLAHEVSVSLTITHNAQSLTVPPRLERIILLLLTHQETIARVPTCRIEVTCGPGVDVSAHLRIPLAQPKPS